ncbi:hypothetical protein [Saliniradius amylolyticus]|uniref:hypothetical protein n=1 Tax=Saliniradius amylolyticus TaxID=2183582 RepID=UPI000D69F11E|nr:hypothetical protein [Saliniradius amylolyticus]
MVDIDQIKQQRQRFEEYLENKDFSNALVEFRQLDSSLRSLSTEYLASLSEHDRAYLNELALRLRDNTENLEKEAARLVDILAPFNKNSALNKGKHYRKD